MGNDEKVKLENGVWPVGFYVFNLSGKALRVVPYTADKTEVNRSVRGEPPPPVINDHNGLFVPFDNIGSAGYIHVLFFFDEPDFRAPPGEGIIQEVVGSSGSASVGITVAGFGFSVGGGGGETTTIADAQTVRQATLVAYPLPGDPNQITILADTNKDQTVKTAQGAQGNFMSVTGGVKDNVPALVPQSTAPGFRRIVEGGRIPPIKKDDVIPGPDRWLQW